MDLERRTKRLSRRFLLGSLSSLVVLITVLAVIAVDRQRIEPFVEYDAQRRQILIDHYGEHPDPDRARELMDQISAIVDARYLVDPDARCFEDLVPAPDGTPLEDIVSLGSSRMEWDGSVVGWRDPQDATVLTILIKHAISQGVVDIAAELMGLQGVVPAAGEGDEAIENSYRQISGARSLARALRTIFVHAILQGDHDLADRSLKPTVRFHTTIHEVFPEVHYGTHDAAQRIIGQCLIEGTLHNALPRTSLETALTVLNEAPAMISRRDRIETIRLEGLGGLQRFYHGVGTNALGEPIETISMFDRIRLPQAEANEQMNAILDWWLSVCELPYAARHSGRPAEFEEVAIDMQAAISASLSNSDDTQTTIAACRILLAIEIYHARNGTPPPNLEALRDLLGGSIPIDRMSGLPFVYHPDATAAGFEGVSHMPYILYSSGNNGTLDHNPVWVDSNSAYPPEDRLWTALPTDEP